MIDSKKKKYLKIRPDEQSSTLIEEFDKEKLWNGIISEMEVGDKMIIEVVEMAEKRFKSLGEFIGW